MYGSAPAPQLASNQIREATPEDVAEAELVARAQHDPRAFAPLYTRYADPVYRYCFRRLGSEEAAADATSAIFAKALAALPRYRTGSFRSWLFTIAHNVTTDHLRQRSRTISMELAPEPVDPHAFEDSVLMAAEWERIERALTQLSPDQQQVIALRLAGLTAVEIGAALGKPRNAIDGLQHRALLRLKSLVATSDAAVSNGQGGGYGG